MNIDPRTMKELLQLQLLNKMSLLSSDDKPSSGDSGLDFGELLETVMGQASPGAGTNNSNTAALRTKASSLAALNKAYTPYQTMAGSSSYDPLIQEASILYGVDPNLVKAVIHQESSFNSQAVSSAGAKGLMQLMDGTGESLGVTNPFDPKQNVHAGTHFLADLLRKYKGNEGVALAAYNAGPGRVDRLGIRTDQDLTEKLHLLPKETQGYVRKVLNLKSGYEV